MKIAAAEALSGIEKNHGGPFGAVISKEGRLIARAHNEVIKTNDPTAHAEIVAIRKAARRLGSFDLNGCEIFSTCEPCPMCLAAIHWARIKNLYFCLTRHEAEEAGFDDNYLYELFAGTAKERRLLVYRVEEEACLEAFTAWKNKSDKILY